MQAAGRGTLINMVSTEAMPGLSAYIASKQGLVGFTQSLAAELGGSGIHAIAFGPGMVETPGLRSAGERLAPLLGMTSEQFFSVSLHPAYSGLMPVEHAGLAAAYLVARLAEECHGESVTGYAVLERAGLLKEQPEERAGGLSTPVARPHEALLLCDQLVEILAETAADFDRLPLFIRPLARSGFKGKAGMPIQARQQAGAALRSRVAEGAPMDAALTRSQLTQLINYIRGVPAETARFTRDPELLRTVRRPMAGYAADLQALCAALEQGL